MIVADDALREAHRIHRDAVVVAMHTDLIGDVAERHSVGEQAVLERRHAKLFRDAGVDCVCDHVIGDTFETQCFPTRDLLFGLYGESSYNPSRAKHSLKILEYMLSDIDQSPSYRLATSVADIRSCASDGVVGVVLCTQGLTPIEDELVLLHVYYRQGLRILGMAVSSSSNAAIGNYRSDIGLTRLGRRLIEEASGLRMVLDVSSISQRGFREVLEMTEGPVIASLSNAAGVFDYAGNCNDEQLKAIADRDGVVAPIANANTVTGAADPTVEHFVDHIDYIARLVGVRHVGIGPDLVEATWYPKEAYERLYADFGYWQRRYPEGFDTLADLPNVTAALLRRGYSEADVRLILGENALRVYETVWGR